MSDRKRLLEELRVIDLRAELEKRNLDKTGIRSVLIQRLSKHLEEEGHDPATFKFELSSSDGKTPVKKSRRTESAKEPDSEETPVMEDMIVQDTAGDEEDNEQTAESSTSAKPSPEKKDRSEEKMDIDDTGKSSRKREIKDDSEATQAKKACMDKEIKNDDDHKIENNTDAEDSINLDIGDDELLNEETDNPAKNKKGQDILSPHCKIFEVQSANSYRRQKNSASRSQRATRAGLLPLLPLLTIDTDLDEPVHEDAAGTTSVEPTANNSTAATDAAPAENQQQVNTEAPATSNDNERNEKDSKDDKTKDNESEKSNKKDDNKEGGARNLWVSGLSGDTRAKDLKQLCSKHGKVIGAKIVTNARTPGSRCYGYVTMASGQDADNCIKNLHRTELHGRMISVEKAKSESESASRRQTAPRPDRRPSKERTKDDTKENEENKEGGEKTSEAKTTKEGDVSGAESNRSTSRTREKSHRSDKDRARRSTRSRERRRSPREVLSFSKIWKERDVARARERSRAAREEERRRRAAEDALRERERRQRQEKHRLAIEREKLRAEREKIEREKNELLRLERERHRLEREKLELERLELKRAQLRLEEERRKRGYESGAAYRKPAASPPPEPAYERERDQRHKRPPPPPMNNIPRSNKPKHFEAPPPPRFELAPAYERGADKRDRDRDYKRDYPRHVSSGNMKYPSNGSTNDDTRQPMPPGTRPKEPSRSYDSRDNRSYRPSPPSKPEPRNWNASNRYPETAPPAKGGSGSGSGEQWSGETRYGGAYEARYPATYQPPPPGAAYPDRYAPAARDFPRKY